MSAALLDAREACERLFGAYTSTTRQRLYRMAEAGEIQTVRDGRRIYVPASVIKSYTGDKL